MITTSPGALDIDETIHANEKENEGRLVLRHPEGKQVVTIRNSTTSRGGDHQVSPSWTIECPPPGVDLSPSAWCMLLVPTSSANKATCQ